MSEMLKPEPTENVIAHKKNAGRVTVHGWRQQNRAFDAVADCQTVPKWHLRTWLWLEFRTLNPELADLCKKCWTP